MTLLATLDRLWEPKWDPIRNYQTVSLGTRVNNLAIKYASYGGCNGGRDIVEMGY